MKRALFIVGAGRCGSSLVAQLLNELGVHLCDHLIGPHPQHNPNGHFECREFWQFGERLRKKRDDAWVDEMSAEETGRLNKLMRTHRRDAGDAPVWAVKSPNFCHYLHKAITAAEWCGHEVRVVAIHRSFASIVASRMAQNRLSYENATSLQANLLAQLYRQLRDCSAPVLHVQYEHLLADPRGACECLAAFALHDLFHPSEAQIDAAARCVDPSLNHHELHRQ